jgi:mono/diheme cytochrome c family protein
LHVQAVAKLPQAEIMTPSQVDDFSPETVNAPMAALALSDKALEGKKLFLQHAQPGCGVCHSLADANARGVVGPNLNQLSLSVAQVENAIAQGVGAMPAYGAQLSQSEIKALAAYVVEATR